MSAGSILTVLGPLDPARLGACQAHEHLFVREGPATRRVPELLLDRYDATLEELRSYRAAGGEALVDAQPVGSGRMAELQVRASRESGVSVVAVTGFHRPFFYEPDHWIHEAPLDHLVRLFCEELRNGMFLDGEAAWPVRQGTTRAGLIKTAAGPEGLTGRWRTLFEAAALASRETGAPVMVHTEGGQGGPEIVRFFMERGVPADWLILCHLDRISGNADQLCDIASTGAWLGLDTIGRFKYHDDAVEAALIGRLLEAGHGGRILLGLDTTRARMRAYGGSIGLDYLWTQFLPFLRQCGIGDAAVRRMLFDNPARAFRRRVPP